MSAAHAASLGSVYGLVPRYFELVGNRAIYHDSWVAASGPVELPWAFSMKPETIDSMRWELYHVAEDYSEAIGSCSSRSFAGSRCARSGGEVSLWLNDQPIGQGRLSRTVPWVLSYAEGLNVGLDTGTPVSEDYAVPFAFAGVLHSLKVALL